MKKREKIMMIWKVKVRVKKKMGKKETARKFI